MKTRYKMAALAAALGTAGVAPSAVADDAKPPPTTQEQNVESATPTVERAADEDQPTPTPETTRTDLQDLIQYFREQRAEFLQARQQLRQQLAEAQTDEERRAIMQAFREQHRDRIREQTKFRRELRLRQMEIRRHRRRANSEG